MKTDLNMSKKFQNKIKNFFQYKIKFFFNQAFIFVKDVALKYVNDDITLKAAGLAFYQLLILIPLMVLLFFIIAKIFNNPEIYSEILRVTAFGKQHIISGLKSITDSLKNKGIIVGISSFLLYFILMRKYLRELIFAVKKIIGQKQETPNTIKASVFRYLKNLVYQYLWIFIFILIIAISSLVSGIAYTSYTMLNKMFGTMPWLVSSFLRIILLLIPLSFYMLFHYFLYWYVPDFRPQKRFALFGAIFATTVNAVLRFLYSFYVNKMLSATGTLELFQKTPENIASNAAVVKATFKLIAAIVIWFFLSSVVVLLGAILVRKLNEKFQTRSYQKTNIRK